MMAKQKLYKVLAMKSVRHHESDVLRNGATPIPNSYAVPGRNSAIFFVTKDRLEQLQGQAAIRELEGKAPETETPADDPPQDHLPSDFPYRKQLAAAGLKTRTLVREHPDLTEIDGIGDAYAERIREALDALEGGDGD